MTAVLAKGSKIVHMSLLHAFLEQRECETYWPAFLRENVSLEHLGDLSPGELKQCTGTSSHEYSPTASPATLRVECSLPGLGLRLGLGLGLGASSCLG